MILTSYHLSDNKVHDILASQRQTALPQYLVSSSLQQYTHTPKLDRHHRGGYDMCKVFLLKRMDLSQELGALKS